MFQEINLLSAAAEAEIFGISMTMKEPKSMFAKASLSMGKRKGYKYEYELICEVGNWEQPEQTFTKASIKQNGSEYC